jgi:hypothetical protein
MQPAVETSFKVCSGYVLSSIRRHLQDRGFKVEKVEITGELQEMVERSYVRWCIEVGVPAERLEDKRRFWTLLEWVAERPELREACKDGMEELEEEVARKSIRKARASCVTLFLTENIIKILPRVARWLCTTRRFIYACIPVRIS